MLLFSFKNNFWKESKPSVCLCSFWSSVQSLFMFPKEHQLSKLILYLFIYRHDQLWKSLVASILYRVEVFRSCYKVYVALQLQYPSISQPWLCVLGYKPTSLFLAAIYYSKRTCADLKTYYKGCGNQHSMVLTEILAHGKMEINKK